MLRIKNILGACILVIASCTMQPAVAQTEEFCYTTTKLAVLVHSNLKEGKYTVEERINELKSRKDLSAALKPILIDMVYWAENRKNMSSEDISKLYFLKCYSSF